MPSTCEKVWSRMSRSSGLHGPRLRPQLPVTMLVTP